MRLQPGVTSALSPDALLGYLSSTVGASPVFPVGESVLLHPVWVRCRS